MGLFKPEVQTSSQHRGGKMCHTSPHKCKFVKEVGGWAGGRVGSKNSIWMSKTQINLHCWLLFTPLEVLATYAKTIRIICIYINIYRGQRARWRRRPRRTLDLVIRATARRRVSGLLNYSGESSVPTEITILWITTYRTTMWWLLCTRA